MLFPGVIIMMKTLLLKIKKYRAPLLTSFFVGTSYIPFPPWAIFFCYVPLWIFLTDKKTNLRQAWWGSWLAQFFLTLIGFNWVAYLVKEFAFIGLNPDYSPLFWLGGIFCQLLFCAGIHLYIPLAATLGVYIQRRWGLSVLRSLMLQALLLSIMERIWPSIFPWHLGYTLLWGHAPVAQIADLIGFEGLSTWILLSNAFFAHLWLQKERTHFRSYVSLRLVCFAVIFILFNIFGLYRKSLWKESDEQLSVHLIQGNIGNSDKVYAERGWGYQSFILEKYLSLTRKSLDSQATSSESVSKPDLLIWPETAFPDYLNPLLVETRYQKNLRSFLQEIQLPLLTGAFAKEGGHQAPRRAQKIFNSLFLLNTDALPMVPPYNKTHLVAFSEYFPFSNLFPILLELPFVSNFGRGPGPTTLLFPRSEGKHPISLGAQICYEGLYPEFSREMARKGAEIFVNLTNDSWFGWWAEPYQHMTMTQAKSIEMRRPLIRATNTGISTIVLATGDLLKQSPTREEWFGAYNFPYRSHPELTFYTVYGHWDWILYLLIIGSLIFIRRPKTPTPAETLERNP